MLKKQRLLTIDLLRALAIMGVVAIHIPHWAPGGWRNHPFFLLSFVFDFGNLGVPLFVLISGFCIHLRASSQKKKQGNYAVNWSFFYRKSFYRIYPPYIIAIIFSLFCAFWIHSRYTLRGWSFLLDLVSHVFLFHNITVEYAVGLGNGALWFLGMEAHLYLLYFPLIWLISKFSYRNSLIAVIAFTIAWRIMSQVLHGASINLLPMAIGDWSKWAFFYWGVWLLGAFSAEAYHGNLKLPKWSSSFVSVLIFGILGVLLSKNTIELLQNTQFSRFLELIPKTLLKTSGLLSGLFFVIFFFCLLNFGIKNEGSENKSIFSKITILKFVVSLVCGLGLRSYSIYLVHVPVILVLDEWLDISFEPTGWITRQFVYWTVILGVSSLFYVLIEKPCLNFMSKSNILKTE